MSDIVIYENGEVELTATVENETVWLSQSELTKLFDKDQSVISRHISNIFKDKEVDEKSNMQKMHIANSDKPVTLYSLDIILAVGYRTNSAKAINFRKWSSKILKDYLIKGYALNKEKLQQKKLDELNATIELIKSNIDNHDLTLAESSLSFFGSFSGYKYA